MALIGTHLVWIGGPFLIPHEYLGNLVSSLGCNHLGCSVEKRSRTSQHPTLPPDMLIDTHQQPGQRWRLHLSAHQPSFCPTFIQSFIL